MVDYAEVRRGLREARDKVLADANWLHHDAPVQLPPPAPLAPLFRDVLRVMDEIFAVVSPILGLNDADIDYPDKTRADVERYIEIKKKFVGLAGNANTVLDDGTDPVTNALARTAAGASQVKVGTSVNTVHLGDATIRPWQGPLGDRYRSFVPGQSRAAAHLATVADQAANLLRATATTFTFHMINVWGMGVAFSAYVIATGFLLKKLFAEVGVILASAAAGSAGVPGMALLTGPGAAAAIAAKVGIFLLEFGAATGGMLVWLRTCEATAANFTRTYEPLITDIDLLLTQQSGNLAAGNHWPDPNRQLESPHMARSYEDGQERWQPAVAEDFRGNPGLAIPGY